MIEGTAVGVALRDSLWLYPAVQTFHLLGIALLFGSIAVVDLRLLGVSRTLPLRGLERHVLPWTGVGMGLAALSGALLFTAQATEYLAKPIFVIKLALIAAAGCNAVAFHLLCEDMGSRPRQDPRHHRRARMAGALSLILWIGVITCGRLLAYL
ncbi:MAG: hypothetical protein H0T80_19020 [Betaproteobacteria bacterium]|nr:hypothetical protein [Betaproteobacteria bacterium]MBA3776081.1 hypothetical protein [Betaproteobacteria bacterium]